VGTACLFSSVGRPESHRGSGRGGELEDLSQMRSTECRQWQGDQISASRTTAQLETAWQEDMGIPVIACAHK
jgi:hypothetical protein